MAQRLERSIGEAMPSSAIEKLNARMEEISARFEAALAQEPKLETLHHIERQVADMGFQLGRVEQQAARIGAVEGQLQRLVERIEATPAQIERTATKAAQETARLVSETGLGKPSAAERLDALHRDIVAMNERNLATDDRLVDTLDGDARVLERAHAAGARQSRGNGRARGSAAHGACCKRGRRCRFRSKPAARGGRTDPSGRAAAPAHHLHSGYSLRIRPRIWLPLPVAPRKPLRRVPRNGTPCPSERCEPQPKPSQARSRGGTRFRFSWWPLRSCS